MSLNDFVIQMIKESKYDEAQILLNKLKDNNFQKWNLLGLLYFNKGELGKAKTFFKKSLDINPVSSDTLFNYAYLLNSENDYLNAWRYLMRIYIKDWAVYDILGDIEINKGSKSAALKYYEKASKLFHDKAMDEKFMMARKEFRKDKKIAFFCLPSLETFIKPIYEYISCLYPSKLVISNNIKKIKETVKWADILWLEWANETANFITNECDLKNKKVVCRIHGYEVFTQFPKQINWKLIDKIIFVNPHKMELFNSFFENIVPRDKQIVIFNGVDLNKFSFNIHEPGKNLLIMGNINYRKGFETLLLSFSNLLKKDASYILNIKGKFQDARYKDYVSNAIKELQLNKNIVFVDKWIDNINEWLDNFDYILSTSIEESFHYTIAEAMSKGIKPVINAWPSSRDIWPSSNIFTDTEGFVKLILDNNYNSNEYRSYIEDHYSIEMELKKIEKLFDEFYKTNEVLIGSNTINNKPLVTIGVTNYNAEKYVKYFLDSVVKQTYNNIELIIIDDASTDKSPKIIEEYTHKYNFIKLIKHSKNMGNPDYGRNEILKMASGKYLIFFDSDDMLSEKYSLEHFVNFMEENSEIDYAYTDFFIINENNKVFTKWINKYYSKRELINEIYKDYGKGSMPFKGLFKLSFLKSNKINYEINGVAGDTLFLLKCLKKDMQYKKFSEIVVSYRIHSSNLTLSKQKRFDSLLKIVDYILENFRDYIFLSNKDERTIGQKIFTYFKYMFYIYETEIWKPWKIDYDHFKYIKIKYDNLVKILEKYKNRYSTSKDSYDFLINYIKNLDKTNGKPLVSILIQTYNRQKFFKEALESAINQTYPNIEILIGDNSSTDETYNYMKQFLEQYNGDKKIVYYNHRREREKDINHEVKENDSGRANANFLLKKAHGAYLNFLHDDDLIHKDKIRLMMHFFILENDISLITSYRKLIDENGNFLPDSVATKKITDMLSFYEGNKVKKELILSTVNFIGEPSTVLIRKIDIKNGFGNYKGEDYSSLADLSQWLECLEHGNLVYIPYALNFTRKHSNQSTHNPLIKLRSYEDRYKLLSLALKDKLFEDSKEKIKNLFISLYETLMKENIVLDKKNKVLELYRKKLIDLGCNFS